MADVRVTWTEKSALNRNKPQVLCLPPGRKTRKTIVDIRAGSEASFSKFISLRKRFFTISSLFFCMHALITPLQLFLNRRTASLFCSFQRGVVLNFTLPVCWSLLVHLVHRPVFTLDAERERYIIFL